jgi:glucosamine--fructose-6-phosphate aminotransferase (isomerizing)
MKGLIEEIQDIPKYAKECLDHYLAHKPSLPLENTFYVGMGSSYYAPLTLFYCGVNIQPVLASEHFYYRASIDAKPACGVLISQSGESSETVWNIESFEQIISITNQPESTIGKASKKDGCFQMLAGVEKASSTKTYMNTLIILYVAFNINPQPAVQLLETNYEQMAASSQEYAKKIFEYETGRSVKGRIIIGSGPNMGTAYQGSLTMSECTRELWTPMTVSQYDHGPKECSENTVVVILNANGKDKRRIEAIKRLIQTTKGPSAALVIELMEDRVSEQLSPITFNLWLNLIMNCLGDLVLGGEEFAYKVGGKVTLAEK